MNAVQTSSSTSNPIGHAATAGPHGPRQSNLPEKSELRTPARSPLHILPGRHPSALKVCKNWYQHGACQKYGCKFVHSLPDGEMPPNTRQYSLNPPRSDTSISSPLHHPRKSVSIIPGGALQPPTPHIRSHWSSPRGVCRYWFNQKPCWNGDSCLFRHYITDANARQDALGLLANVERRTTGHNAIVFEQSHPRPGVYSKRLLAEYNANIGAKRMERPLTATHMKPPGLPEPKHSVDDGGKRESDPTWLVQGASATILPHAPTDSSNMSCPVHKYMAANFGPGFVITGVTTQNETRNLVIENLPGETTEDALAHLLNSFGGVVAISQIRSGGSSKSKKPLSVRVTMRSHQEAIAVANGLNGMKALRCDGQLSVRPELPLAAITSQVSDSIICASWTLPTISVYCGFHTSEEAEMVVKAADGYDWNGYWITASIYSESPFVNEHNVRLRGFPPKVEREDVCTHFGFPFRNEDVMIDWSPPLLHNFGIPQVKRRLAGLGTIVSFDVPPAPYKDGVVRAWCRFQTPDMAATACQLDGIEQECLHHEKIGVSRVYSLSYPIRRDIYKFISEAISELRGVVCRFRPGCLLNIFDNAILPDNITVEISADCTQSLQDIRARLADIVQGEIVMNGNAPLWDRAFSMPLGAHQMNEIRKKHPSVLIVIRRLRSFIRVIGAPENRAGAIAAVHQLVATFKETPVRTIALPAPLFGLFMHKDLIRLREKHGANNLWIDIKDWRLYLRGDEAMYSEVQTAVRTASMEVHSHGHSRTSCPVCFDEPTPSIVLSCGDVYCKGCLASYLAAGAETRQFPLTCFGNDGRCQSLISLHVARDVLQNEQWDLLVATAFNTHVVAKPDEFRFCPTPDCQQVYRPGAKDTVYTCPECLLSICPYCDVGYHEGITCDDHSNSINGAFDEYVRVHDIKPCPGCHVPIERASGCNHMTCTLCQTHTCWECLQTFEKGVGIYDHMRQEHGSIGV